MKTIRQVAELSGVSVRTLHYYDEIGLLAPAAVTGAGYRLYDAAALARLQQILFFRELDFPLADIRRILDDPAFDRRKAMAGHRALLQLKLERLQRLIGLVDGILDGNITDSATKGETKVDFEAFDQTAIREARSRYAKEVAERWGGTEAYRESERRTAAYGEREWAAAQAEMVEVFRDFAAHRKDKPDSEAVQALVARWQETITRRYYPCTKEILSGLGEMYIADPRFTQSIDRYADGLAQFISDAIRIYCREES